MTEQFPESLEFLERIAVDPNDSPAQQRLNAFHNNLGLEVGVFGGFKGLGELWKRSKDLRKGVVDTTVLGTQPIKTFVVTDEMSDSQAQLADIRRRSTI